MIIEASHYKDFLDEEFRDTVNSDIMFQCEKIFPDMDDILKNEPDIFANLTNQIKSRTKISNGIPFIEDNDYSIIRSIIDTTPLKKNASTMFELIYSSMVSGHKLDFGPISQDASIKICEFAAFYGKLAYNLRKINIQKNKDFLTASNVLKESFLKRPLKEFYILQKWLLDWAKYLLRESSFSPLHLKSYKQGEIVLVDFGFRIGSEFGGRHYAVVLEKNNNHSTGVILLAPISSYDPNKGQKAFKTNVDLGIGAIHNYTKGSQVVMNQIGYYSKMRIESPKTSNDKTLYIKPEKLNEIIDKLCAKLPKKEIH
ncbi:MAG: type II toxin-antitoxin system PemK/MazF family toxin [Acidaminococcaceae bacterium]|nr:type II toxin-antitoxin system PemK/MazF family toxin [Acidaminococcaceae bacterium]MBQ5346183.1 type II toxin-antitoxin system PemK/MazF family toxin [Acidaminococcaceae bacterium]